MPPIALYRQPAPPPAALAIVGEPLGAVLGEVDEVSTSWSHSATRLARSLLGVPPGRAASGDGRLGDTSVFTPAPASPSAELARGIGGLVWVGVGLLLLGAVGVGGYALLQVARGLRSNPRVRARHLRPDVFVIAPDTSGAARTVRVTPPPASRRLPRYSASSGGRRRGRYVRWR